MADSERGRDTSRPNEPNSPNQTDKKAVHRKDMDRDTNDTDMNAGMEFDDNDIEERAS